MTARGARRGVRDANCVAFYQGGATLQEIGDVFGVSRECVRQIVRRHGVEVRPRGSTLDPLRVIAEARRSSSVGECARRVGANHNTVTRLLNALGLREVIPARRKWTKASVIVALQTEALKLGRTPRQQDVAGNCGLHSNTVHRLFGTWCAGIDAAGLPRAKLGRWSRAEPAA